MAPRVGLRDVTNAVGNNNNVKPTSVEPTKRDLNPVANVAAGNGAVNNAEAGNGVVNNVNARANDIDAENVGGNGNGRQSHSSDNNISTIHNVSAIHNNSSIHILEPSIANVSQNFDAQNAGGLQQSQDRSQCVAQQSQPQQQSQQSVVQQPSQQCTARQRSQRSQEHVVQQQQQSNAQRQQRERAVSQQSSAQRVQNSARRASQRSQQSQHQQSEEESRPTHRSSSSRTRSLSSRNMRQQGALPRELLTFWAEQMKIEVNPTTGKEYTRVHRPQGVHDYTNKIYIHLRESERDPTLKCDPHFLDVTPEGTPKSQLEIQPKMRLVLLDWLVEVHYKFKLVPETLYLCVNLIDRFLSKNRTIKRQTLQLVGGTCMLIASKYEEFRPPEVNDICYIMDHAYSKDQILDMEVEILNTLNFRVTVPSALQFLEFFIQQVNITRDDPDFFLSQYVIEATLLNLDFIQLAPSEMAACALYLANRIRKRTCPWPTCLEQLTGYGETDFVKPTAKKIFQTLKLFKKKSLFKKYSMEKYHAVAPTIPEA